MDRNLRFEEKSRLSRMVQAVLAVIIAWLLVPIGLIGIGIAAALIHPRHILQNAKTSLNGWIALIWATREILRINWKA